MHRRLTAFACLLALAVPAAAVAQDSSPFAPLPPAQTQAADPAPVTTTTDDDDGLERWQQALIALAGVFVLIGIGWAIVADARSRTPGLDRDDDERDSTRAGREADLKRRKARSRAAAKRSRAARKRNR